HDGAAELAREAGHLARLDRALGADRERVEAAAPDVAEDEEAQDVVEEAASGVDQHVPRGTEGERAPLERGARGVVEAAGVDGDRDHRAPVALGEPRHAERGVQPAGEGERDRRGLAHRSVPGEAAIRLRRRASRRDWSRAPAVATKTV